MANEINLETLAAARTEQPAKKQETDAVKIAAQVEELDPQQRARVEEIKNGIIFTCFVNFE